MVEKGRHHNILLENRNCVYCETILEDEYHFTLICPLYVETRAKYIGENYTVDPNYIKFCNLLSSTSEITVRNLAMYIYYALDQRNDFLSGRQ